MADATAERRSCGSGYVHESPAPEAEAKSMFGRLMKFDQTHQLRTH
jgi:hypothetical protein